MDKMREEFESWYLKQVDDDNVESIELWDAWKASRAALCAWKSVCDEQPNPDFDPVIICFKGGEIFESEADEDGVYCNICGLEFSHWMPKSAIPNP